MRRNRPLLVVLFVLVSLVPVAAQGVDLIVMVDISASMDPYFTALVDYFVDDLMRNMLQTGDTFHFLSFAGLPEIEMAVTIEDGQSRQAILDKMGLLAPLGLYTDLVSAVDYLHAYTSALPPDRTKQLVLITDGVHDPPPGSEHATDYQEALKRLLEGARSIRKEGWFVHIFSLPLMAADGTGVSPGDTGRQPGDTGRQPGDTGRQPGDTGRQPGDTGRQPGDTGSESQPEDSMLGPLVEELGVESTPYQDQRENGETIKPEAGGFGQVTYPGHLGEVRKTFDLPLEISNSTENTLRLDIDGVRVEDRNWLGSSVPVTIPARSRSRVVLPLTLPAAQTPGEHEVKIRLETSGKDRLFPLEGSVRFLVPAGSSEPSDKTPILLIIRGLGFQMWGWFRDALAAVPLRILIPLLLILLALALILLAAWRFRPTRTVRLRRTPRARGRAPTEGAPIEMLVSLQNRQVGFRNIHTMGKGGRKSVGGGRSAFLLFVVKFPKRIAEVRYNGEIYTFRVVKTQYMPGVPPLIEQCLDQDIPALSSKGFPVVIRFVRYVSALERINRLLHSVYREGVDSAQDRQMALPSVDVGHRFL